MSYGIPCYPSPFACAHELAGGLWRRRTHAFAAPDGKPDCAEVALVYFALRPRPNTINVSSSGMSSMLASHLELDCRRIDMKGCLKERLSLGSRARGRQRPHSTRR